MVPKEIMIVPKDRIAKPMRVPKPPKGTPLMKKSNVSGIRETKDKMPKTNEVNETSESGLTENAKIPLTAIDRTENKLIPSHLE